MKKFGLFIVAMVLGLATLFSCAKPLAAEQELPDQPMGYQELLMIHQAGLPFLGATQSAEGTVLHFEGKDVNVPIVGGFRIHDHRDGTVPDISASESTGMWIVGCVIVGVKYYPDLKDEQCCPAYAWFDTNTFHMVVANGHQIDYPFIERGPGSPRKYTVPILRIKTEGGAPVVSKEDYLTGSISIEDRDGIYGETLFNTTLRIRGRGNSTWGMPKKPYKLKLDSKASLLGMPASKDWALLANYSDKSLLRNRTAMWISEICGMSWTPKMVQVEVYLNSEYLGVYSLCENKDVGKNKVNINVVTETDNEGEALTGDYYFEIEQQVDEPVCWWTWKGVPMMFIAPEYPTAQQQDYAKGYFDQFERALFSTDFADPQKGYANFIDVDSFVNYFIIQELSKNVDGNTRKSTFLTKERGKKLEMYHVWDFDLAFGNADYFDDPIGNGPTGWWIKSYGCQGYHTGWYWRLFQDPAFVEKVKARWRELKPELETVPDYIDYWAAELQDAPSRNFRKWNILNIYVWPNVKVTGSYAGEIKYLKEFYTSRLNWLDQNIEKL